MKILKRLARDANPQVRLRAVQAIRNETTGPRRLRAIGFYALLCQLANEQRHTGEHRRVRVTYDELSARGQMSKRSVKLLLDVLGAAGAVRYERLADPERGTTISVLHLEIQDGAWTPITVAMAHLLAGERPGGHLLRDLGLIVILLEFCAEQREQLGGLRAEVTRSDIAARSGLTVDRVEPTSAAGHWWKDGDLVAIGERGVERAVGEIDRAERPFRKAVAAG